MSGTTGYPYAEGDRLEERNTYFYSPYGGSAFLGAWGESRAGALAELGAPSSAPPAVAMAEDGSGEALLESLYAEALGGGIDRRRMGLLLQRFEVGKRLYGHYNEVLRPIDRDAYRDLALYLRFAELLDLLYEREQGGLDRLNGLIKALDILVSLRAELKGADRGRLARLLEREGEWVAALAKRVEVAL